LGGQNILTLSEQQRFVWDTASQSTKRQNMIKIWGTWSPWPPGYVYGCEHPWLDSLSYSIWCYVFFSHENRFWGIRHIF